LKRTHYREIFMLVSAVFACVSRGQVVGTSIFGSVEDESSANLPQAVVVIRNVENGASRTLVTDEAGRYAAPSIVVGAYQITASKEGFATQIKIGIDTVVGQAATVNFKLSIGELQQASSVGESLSLVVNERQVKELPLNGRSYDSLMTLDPGVVNYASERSGGVGTSNSSVGNVFTVSGRRPQESLFLLNGISSVVVALASRLISLPFKTSVVQEPYV
jgi:Carboxypeptidase regulatory-like domain